MPIRCCAPSGAPVRRSSARSTTSSVSRLGAEEVTDDQGRTVVFDRFLQHLNFCITGDDHPIALPPIPMYLDAMLGTEFVSAITPMVGDAYVLVVAIEGFPSTSYSGILNVLDQLAILYRWSTRFIFLDHIDAEKHLAKERRKWAQKTRSFMNQVFNPNGGVVNQDSVQMVAEVEAAMAEAASNLVAYGYYSSNVILYGRDLQQVEYDAQAVRKELQRIGFSAGSRPSTRRKPTSARCPATASRTSAGR